MGIKYLVMDVDGTLTDGKIYVGIFGELCKAFDVKDGYGIRNILIPAGVTPVIMTGRKSKILRKRCFELGITMVYQGVQNKKAKLQQILAETQTPCSKFAYIGDDENDLECMRMIRNGGGSVGCPCDAVMSIKGNADFVSAYAGGSGAVREFIEWILSNFNN